MRRRVAEPSREVASDRPRSGARVLALIPAYNPRAADLEATLRSMLAQTTPTHVCLIDDGSSPPVEIPDFARPRTRLLRLPANRGLTWALRAGVQFAFDAGYEFICRLDVGDLSYPGRVASQLQFLQDHPGVDLVGAFARVVDLEGRTLFHHGIAGGGAAVVAYLRANAPFRHSTFFARTRPLVEAGSYDPAFDGAEDYELLLRLARTGAVDCVAETLVDYVMDPQGISGTRRSRQLRRRLAAQLKHFAPREPAAWSGVLRTLIVMVTPRSLAQRATLWTWRRRTTGAHSARPVRRAGDRQGGVAA